MFLVVALSIIVFSQISLLRHGNGLSDAVRLRACPDHFDDDALVLAVTEFQKLRDPIDFIKCLLHKRPSLLDSMTEFGSALSEAAFLGNIKVVNLLIGYNAKINIRSDSGFTPLMYASTEGHKNVVIRLIAAGADVFAKDNHDNNPWTLAKNNKHHDIANILDEAMRKSKKSKYTFADNMDNDLEFPDL